MDKINYAFLGKVALEFRVSLDNLCKFLGKENTEEEKMQIYTNIIGTISDRDIKEKFHYMFFEETYNEPENISQISYAKMINFFKRYVKAELEEKSKILKELRKTEDDLDSIKHKLGNQTLTEEEINIVSRYRIKHVISRITFSKLFDVSNSSLRDAEKKSNNSYINAKLDILREFYSSFIPSNRRKK